METHACIPPMQIGRRHLKPSSDWRQGTHPTFRQETNTNKRISRKYQLLHEPPIRVIVWADRVCYIVFSTQPGGPYDLGGLPAAGREACHSRRATPKISGAPRGGPLGGGNAAVSC